MEKKYIEVNEGELIRWRGLWSVATESYALGDVVAHAKSGYGTCTYKAKVGHVPSAATEPVDGASWETVWEEFLMGGQNGTGEGTGDVLSTGKAGGQTILGGTGAGEKLTLGSTAHATKGREELLDPANFVEQMGDLISWYGNQIGVGAGAYCTGIEGNAIYCRSNQFFRWYIGVLADNGTSDSMQLSAAGLDLPVGLLTPKISLTGPVKRSVLSKTADYISTDTDPDIVVIGAITALANTTIVLPTAADNIGRIITVIINGDPGVKNVIVDGEGSETINGAATKTNSDIYSYLMLLCNGVGWNIISSAGTWT